MQNLSCCGTDCSTCGAYGNMCEGCNECNGRVFHAPKGKACPIYECVVENKQMKNCGECDQLPCAVWRSTRDPQFTDEEFEQNIAGRVNALKCR